VGKKKRGGEKRRTEGSLTLAPFSLYAGPGGEEKSEKGKGGGRGAVFRKTLIWSARFAKKEKRGEGEEG